MKSGQQLPRGWWVALLILFLLLLPFLALLLAGALWLWEQGWLLWWLVGAAVIAGVSWGLGAWFQRPVARPPAEPQPVAATLTPPDPGWAPRERVAWKAVAALSADADATLVTDRDRLLAAAEQTLEAVARHYHADAEAPLWNFTLPEALLLSERLSARMRLLLLEHVPMSHRLRVGQLLRVWGYQPLLAKGLDQGRRFYTAVRILRAVSPLNAVVAELRDRLVHELSEGLQDYVLQRAARIWIEEVGRAAIELYSGRLRVDAAQLAEAAAAEGLDEVAAPAALPGELRLLVAGQSKAGKSSLVNALLGEVAAGVDVLPLTTAATSYELREEGELLAALIDTPGVDTAAGVTEVAERAFQCDLLLWVAPAHRADRGLDRAALEAIRARFAAAPERKPPPLLVVASHVDRLRPAREWQPPYDPAAPTRPKEQAMHEAIAAIAADLDVSPDDVIPLRLDPASPWNLETLRSTIAARLDGARQARWLRVHDRARGQEGWRQVWRQLRGAKRLLGKAWRR